MPWAGVVVWGEGGDRWMGGVGVAGGGEGGGLLDNLKDFVRSPPSADTPTTAGGGAAGADARADAAARAQVQDVWDNS